MTKRTLLAAAIAAAALPAYAADAPLPPEAPGFNFNFSFDLGDILADVGSPGTELEFAL